MKTLTKLRRSPSVFVGPDFGKTAKEGADGYYFAMAYGTRKGWRQKEAFKRIEKLRDCYTIGATVRTGLNRSIPQRLCKTIWNTSSTTKTKCQLKTTLRQYINC
jgi:hypothetical protein